MPDHSESVNELESPRRQLSLFDSTCIIVGIIIGAGIYETAPTVAGCMGGSLGTLAIWLAGGLLALSGALCYAELASAYPDFGGDYLYLTRAWGRWAGYLFGWSQLVVVRPGDIALMAFIFARYAGQLYEFPGSRLWYAILAVVVLTLVNILGVKQSKWTQNILTILKALGLMAVILAGFMASSTSQPPVAREAGFGGIGLGLILVLFTYGGWNEMAYVAAEVKKPQRNIVRALVLGTVSVMTLYLLVNVAFLYALGYDRMAGSEAVAVETMATRFPELAGRAIAVIICISALGAVNGLVFTGARITYAMGRDHAIFRPFGQWHGSLNTPIRALLLQGVISLAIIVLAGSFIDTIIYAAPVVWLFFLWTGLSVYRLRKKEPHIRRAYKVTGYPVTPAVFCGCCLFMLYNCITYAWEFKRTGLIVLAGVVILGWFVYAASSHLIQNRSKH